MTTVAPITERSEQMLGELAELDFALAKAVHGRAMAAEDADEMASLGRTYQRLARSVRQTIGLREKLIRDRGRDVREGPPPPRDPVRIARRCEALHDAVTRVIWSEHETLERETLYEMLDDRLIASRLPDNWGQASLDHHVLEMCIELGLPIATAERWRDLPVIEDPIETQGDPFPAPELQNSA